MISEFNNERYRVCLDEHQDTEGEIILKLRI